MATEQLSCNACGAALEVQPATQYTSCAACDAQLEILRSGAAIYSLVQRSQPPQSPKQQSDPQKELDLLDKAWQGNLHKYQYKNRYGQIVSPAASIYMGLVALVVSIVIAVSAWQKAASFSFMAICMLLMALLIWNTISQHYKQRAYAEAKQRYESQRAALVYKMSQQARK